VDLNFRKLYAELMSETPPKIKLESVPILVAIFDIWNSNVLTRSPAYFSRIPNSHQLSTNKKPILFVEKFGIGKSWKRWLYLIF